MILSLMSKKINLKSDRTTENGHTETKLRGKPTDRDESNLALFEKLQG
jgi:hypothetical protein